MKAARLLIAAAVALTACKRAPAPPPSDATLTGVAVLGAPLAGAAITVKGRGGETWTGVADASGQFSVGVAAAAAPYLISAAPKDARPVYGLSFGPGPAKVDALSDLLLNAWYGARGLAAPEAPAPTADEVQPLKSLFDEATRDAEASLASAAYDAPARTLKAADASTNPPSTRTLAVFVDSATAGVSIRTTLVTPSGVTNSEVSSVLPVRPEIKAAIAGVDAALAKLMEAAKSRGQNLADADILPLIDPDYLDDGFAAASAAARIAADLRFVDFRAAAKVRRVLAFDAAANAITVFEGESGEHSYRLTFRQKPGGSWLIYGDQQPAAAEIQAEALTESLPPCGAAKTNCGLVGPRRQVTLGFRAPKGAVLSATVSGGGFFLNAPVNKLNYTQAVDYQATATTRVRIDMESFFISTAPAEFPLPGTPFTIAYAPASGKPVTGVLRTGGTTTEGVSIVTPTGHALADAQPGRPLAFSWTLPKAFPARDISFNGQSLTAAAPGGGMGFQCQARGQLDAGRTSGTIVLPRECQGRKIVEASVTIGVHGPGGEAATMIYTFR